MTADELASFMRFTSRRFGLRFDDRAGAMAELGLRRAAVHGESVASYLERLETGDPAELRALIGELTVGETYFFRHAEQFHAFAGVALPERLAARGRIRVLSAGCSSGEEPYTMAMLVRERFDPRQVAIHAVDLDATALERAARGRYSRWALRAIPPELEQRWFTVDGRDVVLSRTVRDQVTFEQRNLNDDADPIWAPDSWDIVFCRNVLMYFTEERARAAIARITRALVPGGFLFLGHAETLRDRSDLDLCSTHGTFYYQRGASRSVRPPSTIARAPEIAIGTEWFADIQAASERVRAIVDGALETRAAAPPPVAPTSSLAEIRELFVQERFAEALDRLAPLGADDPAVLLLRALALTHAGKLAEAESVSAQLLATDPASAGGHYLVALCRDSAGNTADAIAHARRAGELDPTFAMAHVQLGLIARRSGDREGARYALVRAIALLEHDDAERLAMFGGGFNRQALIALCRAELAVVDRSAR